MEQITNALRCVCPSSCQNSFKLMDKIPEVVGEVENNDAPNLSMAFETIA